MAVAVIVLPAVGVMFLCGFLVLCVGGGVLSWGPATESAIEDSSTKTPLKVGWARGRSVGRFC